MPPFVQQLTSAQIAAIANTIRARWGGQPARLDAAEVDALHGIRID
jgi:mono/diheme cytochrome c family protein